MKSVDPGILDKSVCFTFEPSEFARANLKYMTWCGHYYCTRQYGMERDYYPYMLALYVQQGVLDVRYDGRQLMVKPGEVLLLNCQRPHAYHARDGLEFFYVHFAGVSTAEITDQLIKDNEGPIFRKPGNLEIGRRLAAGVRFYEKGGVAGMLQEAFRVERLLYMLAGEVEQAEEDSPVDVAIRYLNEHIAEELTLAELSGVARLSPYYFSRLFKRQTGYAPLEYVLKTRMERARLLLVHTDKSVTEIAYELGYGSPASFINIFTRKIGRSPKQYRLLEQGRARALK